MFTREARWFINHFIQPVYLPWNNAQAAAAVVIGMFIIQCYQSKEEI